jgi:hypothetical protein
MPRGEVTRRQDYTAGLLGTQINNNMQQKVDLPERVQCGGLKWCYQVTKCSAVVGFVKNRFGPGG